MNKTLLLGLLSLSVAQAGGGQPLAPTEAQLLRQRQANYAALLSHPELLQTGGMCRGIRYDGESKGGSVAFPVGRASPVYVEERGVNFAFDVVAGQAAGQPRRLWCLGNGQPSKPLNPSAYRSPIWRAVVNNLQKKGVQAGHFPDVAGPVDLYWNFAGEQYASRLGSTGQRLCEGRFDPAAQTAFPPTVLWVCGR